MAENRNKPINTYCVLGVMSGTSLDGVDLAFCSFDRNDDKWIYKIEAAETVRYPEDWITRLSNLENSSALDFAQTDIDYGHYLGCICRDFLHRHDLQPDFIASHGHTIFHVPKNRLTYQIGKGACIAAEAGYPVISDFRSLDVALGGQGAPLVPIGDRLLFGNFDYCLNLGGFGNVSFEQDNRQVAFDVCPVNIVLNYYARRIGHEFDHDGELARGGNLHNDLLNSLNRLPYYQESPPKSLGKEWVLAEFLPVVETFNLTASDKLKTICEHISMQISQVIPLDSGRRMLVTGGGALNGYLIENIREKTGVQVVLPDPLTINYKEALIFAFLGVLRWKNEPNCLQTVTGASKDNIGGSICSS